ncbi:primosomal replication protein N, partial [Algisphaera agarilytica]
TGNFVIGQEYHFDVSAAVVAGQEVTFVIDSDGAQSGGDAAFASSENGNTAIRPTLVVNLEDAAPQGLSVEVTGTAQDLGAGSSYSNQDLAGGVAYSPDGTSATLTGNAWKRYDLGYTLTADTVLAFDLSVADAGEFIAIGFDGDNNHANGISAFQLAGSHTWNGLNQSQRNGSGSYLIRVGDHFTGAVTHLVLAADDDSDSSADVTFTNLRVYEEALPQGLSVEVGGTAQGLGAGTSYSDQDLAGGVAYSPDGTSATVTGNAWKRYELGYTLTADTVLAFDLNVVDGGELLTIGFDNDNSHTNGVSMFQLSGSDTWNGLNQSQRNGSGSYQIRVGDFFTGAVTHLVIGADDDANSSSNATFTNLRVYEEAASQGLSVEVAGTAQDLGAGTSYADQDLAGGVAYASGGTSATLTGNAWKRYDLGYTLTADTVLEFDLNVVDGGEIIAIGFDTDNEFRNGISAFQLSGSDTWSSANQSQRNGSGSYQIRVGDFFTGAMTHLVLAADDDADSSVNVTFTNLKVYESSPGLSVEVGGTAQDLGAGTSYADQDVAGGATYTSGGTSATLTGNAWKRYDLGYTLTADTVLEFDLNVVDGGEIIAIGFDTDNEFRNGISAFQLSGSDTWSSANQSQRNGSGSYQIRVGDYFTGAVTHLVLA